MTADTRSLSRRDVLICTAGVGTIGCIAGCLGNGDESDLSPGEICTDEGVPREDLSPETLIPDTPDGWTMIQKPRGVDAVWPADESSYAEYEDPDGRNYRLTVGKFDSNTEVNDVVSPSDYTEEIQAVMGVFGLQVTGDGQVTPPDTDHARELALSAPCVDENNLIPES